MGISSVILSQRRDSKKFASQSECCIMREKKRNVELRHVKDEEEVPGDASSTIVDDDVAPVTPPGLLSKKGGLSQGEQGVVEVGMIAVDGSQLEGGGQMVRVAASLAVIVPQAVRIRNIRAGRSKPGLRAQHRTCLSCLQQICGGEEGITVEGNVIGSKEVTLKPAYDGQGPPLSCDAYMVDIGTAGAITLVAQTAIPCIVAGLLREKQTNKLKTVPNKCNLIITGGTDVPFAPLADYMKVKGKLLRKMGIKIEVEVHQRGFFPKGGGKVSIGTELLENVKGINLTEQCFKVKRVRAYITIGKGGGATKEEDFDIKMRLCVQQMQAGVERLFGSHVHYKAEQKMDVKSPSRGMSVLVVVETENGNMYGNSAVGKEIKEDEVLGLLQKIKDTIDGGACVDEYMQDQLLIYMALARGTSSIRCLQPTLHTQSVIKILQDVMHCHFQLHGDHQSVIIECHSEGLFP